MNEVTFRSRVAAVNSPFRVVLRCCLLLLDVLM